MLHRSEFRAAALATAASLLALAAAGHAQPTPPPPVEVPVVREPPPPVAVFGAAPSPRTAMPPADVAVRITGANDVLWSGDLRVDGNQGAQMNMSLQQADGLCPPDTERRFSRRQTGLNLSLRPAYGRGDGQPYTLNVTWTRASADCALPGTRTVGIETTIPLAPGMTQVVEADGGLRIELSRRK